MRASDRLRLAVVWGLSGLMVLTAALYVAAQWAIPGDPAVILVDGRGSPHSLTVEVRQPQPGGLQTGDQVLAVGGLTVDDWLRRAWRQPLSGAPEPADGSLTYTVERGGWALEVVQPLGRLALGPALREVWSYYLYFGYLLAVGVLLLLRRPQLPAARALLLFASAITSSSAVFFLGLRPSDLRYGWMVALYFWSTVPLFGLLAAGGLHFILVFPEMRPALRRQPAWVIVIYLGVWIAYAAAFLLGWDAGAPPASQFLRLEAATIGMTAVYFPLALGAAIGIYRQTTEARLRRQLRWIVWGLVVALGPWLALSVGPQLLGQPSLLPPLVVGLLWCLIPTTLAVAILREGLFDIDVLINRTLVYGALTGVLAAAYFASVVVLQGVVGAVTGEGRSEVVTVISTLAIAALFMPLRQHIQRFIDRRFYRRKYDAAKTLAAFGLTLRDDVDLRALSDRLVSVVDDTMQPAYVNLWLSRAEGQSGDSARPHSA
jgi:hypothetical protein